MGELPCCLPSSIHTLRPIPRAPPAPAAPPIGPAAPRSCPLPPILQVQHRGLREASALDLATIDFLVRAVKALAPDQDFTWLVEESKENLPLGEWVGGLGLGLGAGCVGGGVEWTPLGVVAVWAGVERGRWLGVCWLAR